MTKPISPLPVVLVGCGAVSQLFYTPALRTLEAAGLLRVTSLVDPAAPARAQLQEFFPQATTSATLAEAKAPSGSLAIIASPPRWHASQTLESFTRGWHVLCEKPMATSGDEAAQMNAAADAAGLILAVGHYKRFFATSQYMKYLCGPLAPLGPLRSFTIAEGGPFTWPAASPAFFQKSETPGGVLLDLGVHALDLLLWWLGDPTAFTYADDAMGGLEANARLLLRFGTTTGRVQLSRDWATTQRYEFNFELGMVGWTVNDANGLSLKLNGAPHTLLGTLYGADGTAGTTNAQAFIAQLQHVVAAVSNHLPVLVDGKAGSRALELIEACYARREFLNQPWLTPAETNRARELAIPS